MNGKHLRLEVSDWELCLLPDLGGAISSLRWKGFDILRPAPPNVSNILDVGCFPLTPYANRIAHGRFDFASRSVSLRRNFGDHPHSLHGFGWQRPWRVASQSPTEATLELEHKADEDWPWDCRATMIFTLDAHGLVLTLTLANESLESMPAGLGFHPYFPSSPVTSLKLDVSRVWLADAMQLPVSSAPGNHFGDWRQGQAIVSAPFIDNALEGWAGEAWISTEDHRVRLRAENCPWLHLYIPGGDYFCVEPVTHPPDAVNCANGAIAVLAPGATTAISMNITAIPVQ